MTIDFARLENFNCAIIFSREINYDLSVEQETVKLRTWVDALNYLKSFANELNSLEAEIETISTGEKLTEALLEWSDGQHLMSIEEYESKINRIIQAQNDFCTKFGHLKFAIEILDCDDQGDGKPSVIELTSGEDIISHLTGADIDWTRIQTEEKLISELRDSDDYLLSVEPLNVFRKRQQDSIRKKLEDQASAIADKYKCEVNSLDFLDACQSEMAHSTDYLEGLNGDGLCTGWGITVEQYYDERNESRIDIEKIEKIMQWVAKNMPLLYGHWQYNQRLNNTQISE